MHSRVILTSIKTIKYIKLPQYYGALVPLAMVPIDFFSPFLQLGQGPEFSSYHEAPILLMDHVAFLEEPDKQDRDKVHYSLV